MKYLYDPQHYADRYDLFTIERCLKEIEILNKVIIKMRDDPKLKMESNEEKQKAVNHLVNTRLLSVKLDRYERREKTIEDWIEADRKEQDAQDHTLPPKGVKCDKCNATMKSTFHHLHNDYDKPIRVLFFFDCPKCKSRKAVFDDGEEWKSKPSLCEKCGSELITKSTRKAHVVTMTTSCSKCGFKEVDVMDSKKDEAERKQKEYHETELLAKYRTEFCLEKEEAEKWITCFEEMSFGQQVYEHELLERSDNAHEQYENLKKLNISELEYTINKSLADNKYDKLILKEPRFNNLVEVDFTVQDTDTSRNRRDSEKQLEKLLSKLLIDTNWRLSNSSITYRLGYLVGQLNGYESEEDLLKLLGKKEVKLKPLDPELEKKYGHSNTVQLYKLFAKQKAIENARLKRLKDEPDGFLLNDTEGGYYSCNICRKSIRANETWWIPEGIFCSDCHRNIINGVIPRDAKKNEKIAFEKWDLKNEFGLSSATINKAVKNGELVGRDFKDKERKTYHTIFLVNENIDFFKTHPRTGEHKQRWHYVDKDGEIIWL